VYIKPDWQDFPASLSFSFDELFRGAPQLHEVQTAILLTPRLIFPWALRMIDVMAVRYDPKSNLAVLQKIRNHTGKQTVTYGDKDRPKKRMMLCEIFVVRTLEAQCTYI
jgi:hypothetical protein